MKNLIFMLIGGLGLFFFGMSLLSEALKRIAGNKLKSFLYTATRYPVIAITVGAFVTVLIQSSSATTIMVVGFVNAGLLALKQAICVVIGANIGTTFTAWMVSSIAVFKITNFTFPAVGIGFLLMKFGRTDRMRSVGKSILGFGILFMGLTLMKDAFAPLQNSQQVKDIFVILSHNPILGILVGIVFTVLLQSSSATIAIVQVLAFNGVISLEAAIPIILGDNIGTTITAQLAALGANLPAKRTAMAHTLFNVIGTLYMLVFLKTGWFLFLVERIVPGDVTTNNIMLHIAVAHTSFNIFNTLIFLPFIGWLEKLSIMMVPKSKSMVEIKTNKLDRHLLSTPAIALMQVRKELKYMLELASKSVVLATEGFLNNNKSGNKQIEEYENAVDDLQSGITQFLVELSQKSLTNEETEGLPVLIHNVNDIERICDHSENIAEFTRRKVEEKIYFREEDYNNLKKMWDELHEMMTDTKNMLETYDMKLSQKIIDKENKINALQKKLKEDYVNRDNIAEYNINAGIVYVEVVDNLEKIGDHLTNIAEGIKLGMRWKAKK